jgi:NAD(P)-dependent dehydrogenase (short-subunit alcohol dehydrogenase family)
MELRGRHVVVTGAAGGIGAALAHRFHAAGARVVVSDRQGLAPVHDALPGSVEIVADVSTEAGNVALIRAAEEAFGPIDLFFANAGVGFGGGPEAPEQEWELSMDVNFHAHRWAARHLLPGWLARGEGYFCSTASAAGLLAQIGSAPYTVQGLRVSCLCPQGVNTPMLRQGDSDGLDTNTVRLAGKVLEPAEVAGIVHRAIEQEQFLVLPHPEVHAYVQVKAGTIDRWLGGMRKLQRRAAGQA